MKPKEKRRHYLVNRPLQLGLVFFLAWLLVVAVVSTWLLTYFITWNSILDHITSHPDLPRLIRVTNASLFRALAVSTLTITALGTWVHIYLTHRIAGPAWRIRNVLAEMTAGGRPGQMKVRSGDYLREISGEINRLISTESRRREELAGRLETLAGRLRQPGGGVAPDSKTLEAAALIEKAAREIRTREK